MATADISHVSEEEENYLRMNLLLTGISQRAVRVLFDNKFHPSCLEASIKQDMGKLTDLKKKRVINAAQWNLLCPCSGAPDSKTFDVPLMASLIRNLTEFPVPSGRYYRFPSNTDTKPIDDLVRITYYRNKLAHDDEKSELFSTNFISAWEDISGAIGRLGGRNMEDECKELRTKRLNQSTVPWNIRLQTSKMLNEWRKNDVNFVNNSAAKKVLKCVKENSCVTITASFGVGKTATLRNVVLKMVDDGFNVLPVTNPNDIVKFYNPNEKTLFVFDDFCGKYSINLSDINSWEPVMEDIKERIENTLTKIIVACRLQVFKDEKFESLSIFTTNVCNLSSEDFCLSQTEKQLIADIYLETKASDIIKYCDLFECFPLLCKLYHDNPKLKITDFFKNTFSVYETEIEQLKKNEHLGKYCALVLLVIFNNALKEEVLIDEISTETNTIIENTCKACGLDTETSRLALLDELHLLQNTFIKIDQGIFQAVNDQIFDFLSYYFGKNIIQCLIENAHCKLIKESFLIEREASMDQFITIVPSEYHTIYMQRMVNDWSNGEIVHVFKNKNMDNPTFRKRFLCYLNSLDIKYQRQLAHTYDKNSKDTVLLQCCFKGDIPLIKWCLYHCVDVNMCRYDGCSPIYVSSQEGFTKTVTLLLDKGVDINICTDTGSSPLYIACRNNHIDIVKRLLDNKADIDKCTTNGLSPICIARSKGHEEIVNLLLAKGADDNTCVGDGVSLLYTRLQ